MHLTKVTPTYSVLGLGRLFMRLLENAVQIEPVTHGKIIQHVRGRKLKDHNI